MASQPGEQSTEVKLVPGEEYSDSDVEGGYDEHDEPTVRLRTGIDLADIKEQKGAMFEIDEEALQEKQYFTKPSPKEMYTLSASSILLEGDDSDDEEDEDVSQFDRISKQMVDITENKDGGVLKKIIKQGIGKDIPAGALVKVHYRGFLEYADEAFDSTYLTGKVKGFKLSSSGDVLPSFMVAAASMKKGEKACFLTTPDYNFGKLGCPPRIPPEAKILWEIEMKDWTEHAEVDDYFHLPYEDRKKCPIDMIIKVAEVTREEAKSLFSVKQYFKACNRYRRAIKALEDYQMQDEEEERRVQQELLKLYVNTALCYSQTRECGKVVTYANQALDLDRHHVKALYLKGKGLHMLSDFQRARHFLKEAQKRKPNDENINTELQKLDLNMKKFSLQERETCRRMFAPLEGNNSDAAQSNGSGEIKTTEKKVQVEECTDAFKDNMKKYLQDFVENEDLKELPFPLSAFTQSELDYIENLANELKLHIKEVGEGANAHVRFIKMT